MTDIANIGFAVDTSQIEKGVASLTKLNVASKSTSSNVKAFNTSMTSAAKIFAGAIAGMNKGILSLVTATKNVTTEQIAAAKQASVFADRIYAAAEAQDKLAASTNKTATSLRKFKTAFTSIPTQQLINDKLIQDNLSGLSAYRMYEQMLKRYGKKGMAERLGEPLSSRGLTEAQQTSRFMAGGIAAQFQDIAVTASMGMNPVLIAMQQGTQLSSYFANGIKGLGEAFKMFLGPVTLVTVAVTGLVAGLIQLVNWAGVGQGILNGLASAMDFVADNSTVVASALMVLATGFTAVGAAMVVLKWSSITAGLKSFGETLGIVGLYVKDFIVKLGKLAISILTNPFVLIPAIVIGVIEAFALFKDNVKSALIDTVDWASEKINKLIGFFVGLKDVVLNSFTLIKKGISEGVDVAKGEASKLMSEAMAKEYIGDETVEKIKNGVVEAVDVAAGAVEKVNTVIADTAKSLGDKVKSVANTGSNKLKEWANALTETEEKTKKLKEAWEDLKRSAEGNIAGLQLEKSLIGAGTYETTYQQTLFDLINQAESKGIDLYGKDNKIAQLREWAEGTARLTEEVELQAAGYDLAKSSVKGFFSDMRQGLKEGQSAWEVFGDAVSNVLDKIIDKIVDLSIDMAFQSTGGDNWFSTFLSGITGYFSPGAGGSAEGAEVLAAAGGPDKIGVKPTMAANGGVFSNGIYSSPTMFAFAKGGKFGVMGEAGPEAVMPLTRGPDGSLGVRADGGSSAPVIVNVINNSNAQAKTEQRQTSQGVEIDVLIDELVGEKMVRPGTSSNNALRAFNNQKLVAR